MTNITDIPSDNDTDRQIRDQFTSFISSLDNKAAENFYVSFFTKSEQIMFLKRLAIILMLERSIPYAHIAKTLDVSPSTVKRLDANWKEGEFNQFYNLYAQEDRVDRFWNIIKILIDNSVHRYGAAGWKWLDDIDELN